MTNYINGKNYRLTADVVYAADMQSFRRRGVHVANIVDVEVGTYTVELLPDPLPTTPGSVIRDGADDLFAIGADGMWGIPGQSGHYATDEFSQPVTVLFDAGASRA